MRRRVFGRVPVALFAVGVVAMIGAACSTPYSAAEAGPSPDPSPDPRQNDAGTLVPVEGGGDGKSDGLVDAGRGPYREVVLADGPVAYWLLAETGGLVAVDETANDLDAAYGTCSLGVPGPFAGSSAVELDGTCEIRAPRIDFAGRDAFTLEIWAKPSVTSTSHLRLFGHGINDGEGYHHFGIYLRDPVGAVLERSIASNILVASSPAPPVGEWVYVVGVYDGSILALYVNGAVVAETADARPQKAKDTPLWIGSNGGENFFRGALAHAAVYRKALSAETIANHYAVGQAQK